MALFLIRNQFLMIASNLRFVKSRIDSIKHNQEVQLIAVSKARSSSEIQEAIDAGQLHFGENYLQEISR